MEHKRLSLVQLLISLPLSPDADPSILCRTPSLLPLRLFPEQVDVKDLHSSAGATGSRITGVMVQPGDDSIIVTSADSRSGREGGEDYKGQG